MNLTLCLSSSYLFALCPGLSSPTFAPQRALSLPAQWRMVGTEVAMIGETGRRERTVERGDGERTGHAKQGLRDKDKDAKHGLTRRQGWRAVCGRVSREPRSREEIEKSAWENPFHQIFLPLPESGGWLAGWLVLGPYSPLPPSPWGLGSGQELLLLAPLQTFAQPLPFPLHWSQQHVSRHLPQEATGTAPICLLSSPYM